MASIEIPEKFFDGGSVTGEMVMLKSGKSVSKICQIYQAWRNMIDRCYSDRYRKRGSYKGVTVCSEWMTFSNFKNWTIQQDYIGKQLDKDIINPSRIIYSPDTCAYVMKITNKFCQDHKDRILSSKVGVFKRGKVMFQASCRNPISGKREWLGTYETKHLAIEAWLKRKYEIALILSEMESDCRVKSALLSRYSKF